MQPQLSLARPGFDRARYKMTSPSLSLADETFQEMGLAVTRHPPAPPLTRDR